MTPSYRPPTNLTTTFSYFAWANLDLVTAIPGLGCIALKGYYSNMLAQIGVLALFGLFCLVQWRLALGKAYTAKKAYVWLSVFVQGTRLALAAIARTICEGFRCQEFRYGQGGVGQEYQRRRFLMVDLSIDCDGEEYKRYKVFLMIMVVLIPIGLPLGAFVRLVQLRPRLAAASARDKKRDTELLLDRLKVKASHKDRAESNDSRSTRLPKTSEGEESQNSEVDAAVADGAWWLADPAESQHVVPFEDDPVLMTSPLKTLFRHYRGGYAWWWECVDTTRRLGLTCGTLLFDDLSNFLLFSIFVSCVSTVAQTEFQPFRHKVRASIHAPTHTLARAHTYIHTTSITSTNPWRLSPLDHEQAELAAAMAEYSLRDHHARAGRGHV